MKPSSSKTFIYITVEPRNSVPRNSDFPQYSDFLLLTDFLPNIIDITRNSDFPQNSDFLPADGRSHYFEALLYLQGKKCADMGSYITECNDQRS